MNFEILNDRRIERMSANVLAIHWLQFFLSSLFSNYCCEMDHLESIETKLTGIEIESSRQKDVLFSSLC